MDSKTQLAALDHLLSTIYEGGTSLETLLGTLGFDTDQLAALRERHLPALADGLIEVIRKRLTWEDQDLWFRILARRFGLDGEPAAPIDEVARLLQVDPPYASHAEGEALQKCRSKTSRETFEKELHRIALAELSKSGERPDRERVVQKLERLADLRAAADLARLDYDAKREDVLKKVKTELDALDVEYQPALEAAEANAAALEAEIKNDVLLRGESLRGSAYQAVYMKGRISWDSEGITNYARSHPEVLRFRKEGQPSVSLRATGDLGSGKRPGS
jgi:hypothetical protein